ncbi:hypothetical protein JIY74_33185 [Vibrio harveyi]|nr:hypothetical protein [Vibrio harveyi]
MKIILLDNSVKEFASAMKVKELSQSILGNYSKNVIAAKVDKKIVDLEYVVDKDCSLELIDAKHKNYELVLNSTLGFITAYAIKQLKPNAKLAEVLFNNDEMEFSTTFELEPRMILDELKQVQQKVSEILASDLVIKSEQVSLDEAKKRLSDNKYQLHLAEKMNEKFNYVQLYSINDFTMVLENAILLDFKQIKAVDIQQLTGSY